MVMEGNCSFVSEPGIYSEAQVAGWKVVTDAVHAKGGRIVLQLWHGGRACHPVLNDGAIPVAPSAIPITNDEIHTPQGKMPYVTPRELADDEIPGIVAGFRQAAENAKAAGFDGVEVHGANGYLITDAHLEAEKAMVSFITGLAQAARANDPYFLIIMQNAEELVAHKAVVDAIDGIAKEDLFYGVDHQASENEAASVAWSLDQLRKLKRAKRKVLVVEYLAEAEKAQAARRRAEADGFVIHFANRELAEFSVHEPDRPQPAASVPAVGGGENLR